MKKRFVPTYSILAIAIVLLAALAPGCPGGATTGTIVVQATLCGTPWQGATNYTLTASEGWSPDSGTAVPTTYMNMTATTWTCAYVSGGPAGAFLNSIKPSASQNLAAGGTITFTFDFELNQDAAIKWLTWTVNGEPWLNSSGIWAQPCMVIDAHFQQWVNGCPQRVVEVNETSWLWVAYTPLQGPPVTIYAVNDWYALNKTPEPPDKVSQVPSFNGTPVEEGANITLNPQDWVELDVETAWQLAKETNYTKSINWLGISTVAMFEQNGPHPCVLFELVVPGPGVYVFTLIARAEVELVDDEDVNMDNNEAASPPAGLVVNVVG